jgi:hypothetical protein
MKAPNQSSQFELYEFCRVYLANLDHSKQAQWWQMMAPKCAWLKFAFYPFSTHEGYVLLLAKILDQPIDHFTFSCNK